MRALSLISVVAAVAVAVEASADVGKDSDSTKQNDVLFINDLHTPALSCFNDNSFCRNQLLSVSIHLSVYDFYRSQSISKQVGHRNIFHTPVILHFNLSSIKITVSQ